MILIASLATALSCLEPTINAFALMLLGVPSTAMLVYQVKRCPLSHVVGINIEGQHNVGVNQCPFSSINWRRYNLYFLHFYLICDHGVGLVATFFELFIHNRNIHIPYNCHFLIS